MGGVTSILFLYVVEHLEMISIPNQSTIIPCCIILFATYVTSECLYDVKGVFRGGGIRRMLSPSPGIDLPTLNKGIFP